MKARTQRRKMDKKNKVRLLTKTASYNGIKFLFLLYLEGQMEICASLVSTLEEAENTHHDSGLD